MFPDFNKNPWLWQSYETNRGSLGTLTSRSFMKIIGRDVIDSCCTPGEAIQAMRDAFGYLSSGQANVPLRTRLEVTDQTLSLFMPACLRDFSTFGFKSVSLTDDNHLRNLPRINGTIILHNSQTGQPVCLLDAERITSLRTGAAVGLSVDLLTPPQPLTLALFGSGNQAAACLRSIASCRSLKQVYVFSRQQEKGHSFCETQRRFLDTGIHWTRDQGLLKECNLICLATSSAVPVFDVRHLPSQFHLAAIGSYQPDQHEFDPRLLESAQVIVDQKQACTREAGEICQAVKNGQLDPSQIVEIGEFINHPGINRTFEQTVFKSVGNAVQDLVLADLVYRKAKLAGLGQEISFASSARDDTPQV